MVFRTIFRSLHMFPHKSSKQMKFPCKYNTIGSIYKAPFAPPNQSK
jgi:hypothetical protein